MMICTDPACPIRGLTAATCTRCGHGFTGNMPGYKEPIRYDAPAPAAEPPQDVANDLARIGGEVDKLLQQAGYAHDSSARHQLHILRSMTAAALAALARERDALAAAMPSEGADAALAYAAERTAREQAERELAERNESLNAAADEIIRLKHDLAVVGSGGKRKANERPVSE